MHPRNLVLDRRRGALSRLRVRPAALAVAAAGSSSAGGGGGRQAALRVLLRRRTSQFPDANLQGLALNLVKVHASKTWQNTDSIRGEDAAGGGRCQNSCHLQQHAAWHQVTTTASCQMG